MYCYRRSETRYGVDGNGANVVGFWSICGHRCQERRSGHISQLSHKFVSIYGVVSIGDTVRSKCLPWTWSAEGISYDEILISRVNMKKINTFFSIFDGTIMNYQRCCVQSCSHFPYCGRKESLGKHCPYLWRTFSLQWPGFFPNIGRGSVAIYRSFLREHF